MKLRYRCLVLDHDDTAVMSTPEIHYPSFVEALKVLRPEREMLSLDEFILHSFSPGFSELLDEVLKLNKEEKEYQYKVWRSYTKSKIPDFYEGFPELIREYKELGGIVTVVSHSEIDQIERDYKLGCNMTPDLIFGWDDEASKRKPSPYPIQEIMRRFNLDKSDILVVDDLKPGMVMAKSCGADFAAVGWAHQIQSIMDCMRSEADYYFTSVEDLRKFLYCE